MPTTRQTAVAGMFYPDNPEELAGEIRRHLAEGREILKRNAPAESGLRPAAIVAPHAGYPYSGPIAGTAFSALACGGTELPPIRRAVILGPSHHVAFRGLATPSSGVFSTPAGPATVDREAIGEILALPQVHESDAAHRHEHSIEVELPFLLAVAGPEVKIVPVVVGRTEAGEVAEVLGRLLTGPDTVAIVSSDLSHYMPYPTATEFDAQTAERILALDSAGLSGERACGYMGLRGLIDYARARHLRPSLLDLRNSGDTAGTHNDQVVGYAAFAFHPPERAK